jgi:alpha-tubulin suppressor-like RCC1 family protein
MSTKSNIYNIVGPWSNFRTTEDHEIENGMWYIDRRGQVVQVIEIKKEQYVVIDTDGYKRGINTRGRLYGVTNYDGLGSHINSFDIIRPATQQELPIPYPNDLPSKAKCVAVDKDGGVYAFTVDIFNKYDMWVMEDNGRYLNLKNWYDVQPVIDFIAKNNIDWKNTKRMVKKC